MNRRCTGDSCLAAAGARSINLDLPIASILMNARQEWNLIASSGSRIRTARVIEIDWKKFNQDNYLFTHASIVASVVVKPDGHTVIPACVELINSNGNAWTNEVLLATFKTFVGGENYLEHVQIPELSKGKILDAVARPVQFVDSKKRTANVYFVDILVATSRRHDSLVRDIVAGEMQTMSMGCGIAGTPVVMFDGTTKPVERILVGDLVRTHTGGVATVESTRVRQTKSGELRRLALTGIPDTYVTGEHPYWTLTGYDVCMGCGKKMGRGTQSLDQILHHWCSSSCKQSHLNSNPKSKSNDFKPIEQKIKFDWVPVSELKKGDYVAIPLGRQAAERKGLEKFKCRLLGYYAAEGNLQWYDGQDGRFPRSVEFSLHAEEPAGDEIVSLAKEWGVPADKIYDQIRNRTGKKGKPNTSRRIVIHDREMAKWLFENCGEHCDGKKFAGWVMDLDDRSLLDVLGSYVSGDGHCRKDSGRFTTASCSKALSEQVWSMMMSLHIPANISERKVSKKRDSWYVNSRKGHGEALNGYTFKFIPQQTNNSKVSNVGEYMLRRVKANEPLSIVCDVYNVHVTNETGDHSYIMNGVAVHNCLADWVVCSKCGKVLGDGQSNCHCLDNEMLKDYRDKDGDLTKVAELCGRMEKKGGIWVADPKSCKFIEASWVRKPAFTGAVLNHYISDISKEANEVLQFPNYRLQATIDDLFKMRVADRNGMMVLRIARDEMMKRKREAIADRIARGY